MRNEDTLNLGKGRKLYYTSDTAGSDTVVVIVHGLTSYIHQSLYEDARRFFITKGIDVCRPELYTWKKSARSLVGCTLDIHGGDLDELIKILRKKYKTIFMIGHSYGAPSIACMEEDVEAVCNWDGTYMGMNLSFFSDMEYIEPNKFYVDVRGAGFIVGKPMYDEAFRLKKLSGWVGSNKAPVHFIYAGNGILHRHDKAQVNRFLKKQILASTEQIQGADHNFNSDDVQDKLFNATYNYFIKRKIT